VLVRDDPRPDPWWQAGIEEALGDHEVPPGRPSSHTVAPRPRNRLGAARA
jgi:hypothetical protein